MKGIWANRNFRQVAALIMMFILCSPALPCFAMESSKTVTPSPQADDEEKNESKSQPAQTADTYMIQKGDRLKITIYPDDQYLKGGEMEVSSEGNITLSLIGKIPIAGKNVIEAERAIAGLLGDDYLVNPEVVIEVLRYKEHSVVILGQVKKPGTYTFPEGSTRLTLLQAIALAGGFSDIANTKSIKIVRKVKGENQVIHSNAQSIISAKESDVELDSGDVIHVGESLF